MIVTIGNEQINCETYIKEGNKLTLINAVTDIGTTNIEFNGVNWDVVELPEVIQAPTLEERLEVIEQLLLETI